MSPSSKGGQLSVEAVLVAVEGRSGRSRLRAACQRTQPVQCQYTASQSGQTQLLEDKRIAKTGQNQCTAKQELVSDQP